MSRHKLDFFLIPGTLMQKGVFNWYNMKGETPDGPWQRSQEQFTTWDGIQWVRFSGEIDKVPGWTSLARSCCWLQQKQWAVHLLVCENAL